MHLHDNIKETNVLDIYNHVALGHIHLERDGRMFRSGNVSWVSYILGLGKETWSYFFQFTVCHDVENAEVRIYVNQTLVVTFR